MQSYDIHILEPRFKSCGMTLSVARRTFTNPPHVRFNADLSESGEKVHVVFGLPLQTVHGPRGPSPLSNSTRVLPPTPPKPRAEVPGCPTTRAGRPSEARAVEKTRESNRSPLAFRHPVTQLDLPLSILPGLPRIECEPFGDESFHVLLSI